MDDVGAAHGGYMHIDPMIEEHIHSSAFASEPSFFRDPREAVNAAAAAESENDAANTNGVAESKDSNEDDEENDKAASSQAA